MPSLVYDFGLARTSLDYSGFFGGTTVGRRPKPLDPNQPLHAFAIELRLLRERAGAAGSEKETCERAEIGRSTYYSYLNGENLPSRESLERVVKAWGCDVAAWLERRRQTELALAQSPSQRSKATEEPSALYTVMVLGIDQLAARDNHHQVHLRRRFDAVWSGAQHRAGVDREIKSADHGDSWLFWEPGIKLVSDAFSRLLPYTSVLLNHDNHDMESSGLLRVRGALHVTEARETFDGVFGSNVNEVFRFADAPILRDQLRGDAACDLAVIFSDRARLLGNLVTHPETFRGIHANGWKEWAGGTAWLYTPLRSPTEPDQQHRGETVSPAEVFNVRDSKRGDHRSV
ncbi:helix-turn-helix domain-containing protein [Streptomyces sp. x-80]|uniref:helix-turn-helix domain-containing protein n=1 Tax=Streptomyces sp. x-80 TaxID=2789282 RepID=UPI00398084C5